MRDFGYEKRYPHTGTVYEVLTTGGGTDQEAAELQERGTIRGRVRPLGRLGWIEFYCETIIPIGTHWIGQWRDPEGRFLFPDASEYVEDGGIDAEADANFFHTVLDVTPHLDKDGNIEFFKYTMSVRNQ